MFTSLALAAALQIPSSESPTLQHTPKQAILAPDIFSGIASLTSTMARVHSIVEKTHTQELPFAIKVCSETNTSIGYYTNSDLCMLYPGPVSPKTIEITYVGLNTRRVMETLQQAETQGARQKSAELIDEVCHNFGVVIAHTLSIERGAPLESSEPLYTEARLSCAKFINGEIEEIQSENYPAK